MAIDEKQPESNEQPGLVKGDIGFEGKLTMKVIRLQEKPNDIPQPRHADGTFGSKKL